MTLPEPRMTTLQTCRCQSSARHWKYTVQKLQIAVCANTENEHTHEGAFSSFCVLFHTMNFHRAEHHSSCLQGLRDWTTMKWEKDIYLLSHSMKPCLFSRCSSPWKRGGKRSCCFANPFSPYSQQSVPKRLSYTVVGHEGLGDGREKLDMAIFPSCNILNPNKEPLKPNQWPWMCLPSQPL